MTLRRDGQRSAAMANLFMSQVIDLTSKHIYPDRAAVCVSRQPGYCA
jgi:hypothetical protein